MNEREMSKHFQKQEQKKRELKFLMMGFSLHRNDKVRFYIIMIKVFCEFYTTKKCAYVEEGNFVAHIERDF